MYTLKYWSEPGQQNPQTKEVHFKNPSYRSLSVCLSKKALFCFQLFAAAFPLAPLIALLTNAIDMRVDARRMLWINRRPVAFRAEDIGKYSQLPVTKTTYVVQSVSCSLLNERSSSSIQHLPRLPPFCVCALMRLINLLGRKDLGLIIF